jgi:hypothetical protein
VNRAARLWAAAGNYQGDVILLLTAAESLDGTGYCFEQLVDRKLTMAF